MNKIIKTISGIMLGTLLVVSPAKAEDIETIDYQTYFEADSVIFEEIQTVLNKDEESIVSIRVMDQDNKGIFSVKKVDDVVYTTTGLNLREVPTINSTPKMAFVTGTEIKRIGDGDFGWDIVEIDGEKYFMWDEYLTTEKPVPAPAPQIIEESYNYVDTNNYTYSGSSSSAKEEIARRESGGSYDARNGKYIGRYQLDSSYLNGDYSPENQERVADEYVANRYGSWEAALAFWNANGWY